MKPSIGAFFKASFVLQLLLLGAAGDYPMVMAQSPGTFTATGNMIMARGTHTATLLFNGKVLIAGGYRYGYPAEALARAELYDPSTGTFNATGDMTAARARHTATLLTDGRVLIAGGYGPLASAELYDPSTRTFTATGDMITPGPLHTATLLGNGKVLIAGGYPTAELYDPATGTFALTGAYAGSYTGPLYVGTATLLPDGRVLITGCDCSSKTAPLTEVYDPATGTFSLTGTIRWMEQVGRSATQETWGYLQPCRYVLHDRDTKFCASFRSALAAGGVRAIPLPAKSPNLNAFAERWVRSVKQECLSKVILFGEGPLSRVLAEYSRHYHSERNHQGKGNHLLFPEVGEKRNQQRRSIECRHRLGGLLKYYRRVA
jgi:hypothetical protein